MAAAHGGQVLVSVAAQRLVEAGLNRPWRLVELGELQLKDLSTPERTFRAAASGLEEASAPLRTLTARSHNLPVQLNLVRRP